MFPESDRLAIASRLACRDPCNPEFRKISYSDLFEVEHVWKLRHSEILVLSMNLLALGDDANISFASFTWSPLCGSSFFSLLSYEAGVPVVAAGAITFPIALTFVNSLLSTASICTLRAPPCAMVTWNFERVAQPPCAHEGDFICLMRRSLRTATPNERLACHTIWWCPFVGGLQETDPATIYARRIQVHCYQT